MNQTKIDTQDLTVNIKADTAQKFTWSAVMTSSMTMRFTLSMETALQGTETLEIQFTNWKVFRGAEGG